MPHPASRLRRRVLVFLGLCFLWNAGGTDLLWRASVEAFVPATPSVPHAKATATSKSRILAAPMRDDSKMGNQKTQSPTSSDNPSPDHLEQALLDILEQEADMEIVQQSNHTTESTVSSSLSLPAQPVTEEDFVHQSVCTQFGHANKEQIMARDEALRWVSSEMGVKQWTHQPIDDAAVATAILLERTLDTLEDIALHLRRGRDAPSDATTTPRQTVVVLGSGWAAHALLKVADCAKLRLVVVSPTNHFVFTPMLASAAVGTVEYRSMTESVRDANPTMEEYIQGKAVHVNVVDKQVQVQLCPLLSNLDRDDTGDDRSHLDKTKQEPTTITLDYDHLIVAVGNQVHDGNVSGARQYCLRLKTCDDARRLRTAVGEAFEYASRPGLSDQERGRRVTFVVVGGGPTGVELAGELSDYCHDITQGRHKAAYPKLAGLTQVVLVHGGPDLLPQFDADLRAEAARTLERQGVKVILHTRVTQVQKQSVQLSTKTLNEQGVPTGARTESSLPMGLSVWCAGIAPVPFVDTLLSKLPDQARGQGGRVHVDRWLRPPMPTPDLVGSVLVLGDAASLPKSQRDNEMLPQTAQVAGQQGAYVARLLTRGYNLTEAVPRLPCAEPIMLSGDAKEDADCAPTIIPCADPSLAAWLKFRNLETAPGFAFLNLGLLAYLGGGKALSQVQIGDVPVFSYAGSVAFVLWKSVYLVKQVATRNRVLVTFDWIKSALFGRDTTRL